MVALGVSPINCNLPEQGPADWLNPNAAIVTSNNPPSQCDEIHRPTSLPILCPVSNSWTHLQKAAAQHSTKSASMNNPRNQPLHAHAAQHFVQNVHPQFCHYFIWGKCIDGGKTAFPPIPAEKPAKPRKHYRWSQPIRVEIYSFFPFKPCSERVFLNLPAFVHSSYLRWRYNQKSDCRLTDVF